ncbi:MAG TPA: glucose 1-dehydrogenase [Steroidobacteraceae bacterium]|jgi:NAD(P)-dependent dehydrogenase (short-subunit alcohol dehydrogenase family)
MTRRFEGKTVLITGAGSGIGRATAIAFGSEGANVVACDVNDAGGEATVATLRQRGASAEYVHVDVSSAADCAAMVERALSRFGRLDVAFNNAGINLEVAPIAEVDEAQWQRIVGINLTGVFLCMRAEIPAMKRTGGGAIINTASVGGLIGTAGVTAYCATKHGVVGLTKSAALDYIKDGIRINAICPGGTRTAMLEEWFKHPEVERAALAGTPIGRMADPAEIARAVMFLASDESSFMVGHSLVADGGLTAQ